MCSNFQLKGLWWFYMYACASCDLLLLSSKLNLLACSLKMDLGPLTMFPLLRRDSFISREHWRDIAGGEGFSSLFSRCFLSICQLQHRWILQVQCLQGTLLPQCPAPAARLAFPAPDSWCAHRCSSAQSLQPPPTPASGGSALEWLQWDTFLWTAFPGLWEGGFLENSTSSFSSIQCVSHGYALSNKL